MKTLKTSKVAGFDINQRVTKASSKSIVGTIWRNKHTQELATITVVRKNPDRGDLEVYDEDEREIDDTLACPLTWVKYGQKWTNAMEHWYRVDHLTQAEKLEGYRRRVGYCKEQLTETRKAYQEMKKMPKAERGSCHTFNTRMRKDDWTTAKKDLDEAEGQLQEFEEHDKGVAQHRRSTEMKTLKPTKVAGREVTILNGTKPGAPLLGYVCSFTVRQGEITLEEVDRLWVELNIPEWSKPNPPRKRDVFKNSCRDLERVDYEDRHPWGACRLVYETDKLTPDEYVLTEKVFAHDDVQGKNLLEHNKLVRLQYIEEKTDSGTNGKITVTKYETLSNVSREKLREYMDTVRSNFDRLLTHNTSDQIRVALRNTFHKLHGMQWGSTAAIYFIPLDAQDVIAKWREFLSIFTENYGTQTRFSSQIRALPFVDSGEHRKYIEEDIAKQAEARFQALLHKTKRQLETQNPGNFEDILKGKLKEKNKIRKELEYYQKLLGTKIDCYFDTLDQQGVKDRKGQQLDGRVQALIEQLNEMA